MYFCLRIYCDPNKSLAKNLEKNIEAIWTWIYGIGIVRGKESHPADVFLS